MKHGYMLRWCLGGCAYGAVMSALMTMLLVLLTGCLTIDQYERAYREILSELATTTTTTTTSASTTTTTTALPPVQSALRVVLTADPAAVAGLQAEGRTVGLFVTEAGIGALPAIPAYFVFRPAGEYRPNNQKVWAQVALPLASKYPQVRQGFYSYEMQHPTYWKGLMHEGIKWDTWFLRLPPDQYSEKQTAGAISKMGVYYGKRIGYAAIACETPHTAAALKAGAAGVGQ